ncbi:MAG: hypothetical protein LBH55_00645 [Mycoplasmataceae bacterium]|jgi:hypothetical protein|nr:hypothetical protein [Mycoplasmataceae bacterium]
MLYWYEFDGTKYLIQAIFKHSKDDKQPDHSQNVLEFVYCSNFLVSKSNENTFLHLNDFYHSPSSSTSAL